MKILSSALLVCSLASLAYAQAPKPATPAAAPTAPPAAPAAVTPAVIASVSAPGKPQAKAAAEEPKPIATLATKDAKLTAPMALKDGVISQPETTGLSDGGKAVFDFTVPKDGNYEIYAVVSAPDDDNNSFFVNVDVEPKEDPLMIWDIELTDGSAFVERVVNWRGEGSAGSDEFDPKTFKLTAGAHKLIFIGREPAKLKSVSIYPATAATPATPAAPAAPAAPATAK